MFFLLLSFLSFNSFAINVFVPGDEIQASQINDNFTTLNETKLSTEGNNQTISIINRCFSHGQINSLQYQLFQNVSLGATYVSPPSVSVANNTQCHGCSELIPIVASVSNSGFNVFHKNIHSSF